MDPGSGISGSDPNFVADPDSGKKKSDPDPEYVTHFFYLYLQFLAVFFMDPDSGSGISGSDTNFLANPDSGKKSDPDPDKRTRIRNTAFYFNRIRLT